MTPNGVTEWVGWAAHDFDGCPHSLPSLRSRVRPAASSAGYTARIRPFVGGVMPFAAGGILYLLFQDIAPQSRVNRYRAPALGAVAGLWGGMAGQLLVSG